MPKDTYTLWGYGLFIDDKGNYVQKPMAECTGREILTELIHQLGFADILDEVLATTDVTTVMMPYASALFSRRIPEDRPLVIPQGAANFAFLGQFVELPEDTVFTVEYSVHCAMQAAYRLFNVNKPIPPIYLGILDPRSGCKRWNPHSSRSRAGAKPRREVPATPVSVVPVRAPAAIRLRRAGRVGLKIRGNA